MTNIYGDDRVKSGQIWVVRLNGQGAVVQPHGNRLYTIGSEEGWVYGRDEFVVEWIRRVKLPAEELRAQADAYVQTEEYAEITARNAQKDA